MPVFNVTVRQERVDEAAVRVEAGSEEEAQAVVEAMDYRTLVWESSVYQSFITKIEESEDG